MRKPLEFNVDGWSRYYAWLHGIKRSQILRRLQSTDYELRKTRLSDNSALMERLQEKYDISIGQETPIEKLAWWVFSSNHNWGNWGRKYIKSVKHARWMYLMVNSFSNIDEELKTEIETLTSGYIKASEWTGTRRRKA